MDFFSKISKTFFSSTNKNSTNNALTSANNINNNSDISLEDNNNNNNQNNDANIISVNITLEIKILIANEINSGNKCPEELAQLYNIRRSRVNYIARKVNQGKCVKVSSGRPKAIDKESNDVLTIAVEQLKEKNLAEDLFRKQLRKLIKEEYLRSYNRRHKFSQVTKLKVPPMTIKTYIDKYASNNYV